LVSPYADAFGLRFAGDSLNSPAYRFDERREAFRFAIFGNHDLHGDDWKPHGARLLTRAANSRVFDAQLSNLRAFGALLRSRSCPHPFDDGMQGFSIRFALFSVLKVHV